MLCGRLRPQLRPAERALAVPGVPAAPGVPVAAPLARPRRAGRRALQTRAFFKSGAELKVAGAPPPYAQLSTPVYSLSTCDAEGGSQTMNLVTYASPISLKPRQYAMGVFVGTLTHSNFLATGRGTLQVGGTAVPRTWRAAGRHQHGGQMARAASGQQQAASGQRLHLRQTTMCPPRPRPCTVLAPPADPG